MIISMDDVDLDGSLVVANMLLIFGGVTNPIAARGITIGMVVVGFSLSVFAKGCISDDIISALWKTSTSIIVVSSSLSSTRIALHFGSFYFGCFGFGSFYIGYFGLGSFAFFKVSLAILLGYIGSKDLSGELRVLCRAISKDGGFFNRQLRYHPQAFK